MSWLPLMQILPLAFICYTGSVKTNVVMGYASLALTFRVEFHFFNETTKVLNKSTVLEVAL